MKITFTETRVVDDHRKGTEAEQRFEAGKTYDLPEASAERWLNRGVAKVARPEPPKATGEQKELASAAAGEAKGAAKQPAKDKE